MTNNEQALLDTIAFSELGKSLLEKSDNGYNVLVGSIPPNRILYIQDYSDHPRILVQQCNSTAAGRYQILVRIFDFYKRALSLKDFSPKSQDAIAIQLLKECKAIDAINLGNFNDAVWKARSRWASLPGAGYQQRENSLEVLRDYYLKSGGIINVG